ncbi:MAG: (2Fe-2S)-binding protein [Dokdonella sp.]|uniref:(2Fe-2S)-binding protein n=1 Tax=Dokdonella sp. TaxID=2291710 RepID=UPI0025BAB626|nr:(2Fe-2S)-binding protein [Dokdonella sp.]MBX3701211.1 (2Fe-2S)-binding protein [Dokdonella sp.]MCW5577604.1 (2Fe-2S)-binding protein [Dokdonella sp.]
MPRPTDPAASPPTPPAATPRPPAPLPITINGKFYDHDGDPAMPLLWFLRDRLRLTGTKYGCDGGECGACSVLVDDKLVRACTLPMAAASGHRVTTIEGLAGDDLHPLQQAWIESDAIQCGYCQSGQILAAVDLLRRKPRPGEDDLAAIANLCRCGSQPQLRRAIARAAAILRGERK